MALARYNAVQAGGLQQAMVHEQERSGAAWTLGAPVRLSWTEQPASPGASR